MSAKHAKDAKVKTDFSFSCVSRVSRTKILKIMKKNEFAEKRKEFGEKSIEELIELLSAEDLQTRFFAEMCLRDATST